MATFEGLQIRDIYYRELYWLVFQILHQSESLFELFPVQVNEVFISTKLEGLDLIYAILSNAAKIHELCNAQRSGELHQDRASYFKSIIESIGVSEILEKKVRNTIEHFGEYLDDDSKNHRSAGLGKKAEYAIAQNFIFSHMEEIKGHGKSHWLFKTPQLQWPIYPVRVYVASEKRFYNMQWSIDLGKIYGESKLLQQYFIDQKLFNEPDPENWTSGLLFV